MINETEVFDRIDKRLNDRLEGIENGQFGDPCDPCCNAYEAGIRFAFSIVRQEIFKAEYERDMRLLDAILQDTDETEERDEDRTD